MSFSRVPFFLRFAALSGFFLFVTPFAQAQVDIAHVNEHWRTQITKAKVPLNEFYAHIPKSSLPPVYQPDFWNRRQAEGTYHAREPMVVLTVKSVEKAYPLSILIYHPVINDKIAGIPVAITYCPLSSTVAVYDRRPGEGLGARQLRFSVSGMLRNASTVLWDLETESWWQQTSGQALVGEMAGSTLDQIPFMLLSFEQYYNSFPYGLVMANNIDDAVPYGTTPYYKYENIEKEKPELAMRRLSPRLPAMQRVVAIEAMGDRIIYPVDMVKNRGVLNDTPNDVYIALFYQQGVKSTLDEREIARARDVGTVNAFSSFYKNMRLTFSKSGDKFIDEQTGSFWNISGICIEGALKGGRLRLLKHSSHFAFAALSTWPESRIFGESH